MTSLPKFEYKGTSHQLPATRDIVDKANPLGPNHQFRPVGSLTQTMHDYALACANQIDVLLQKTKTPAPGTESDVKAEYKILDPQKPERQYWKIEKPDTNSPELKYTIAASKANGAWEKFSVYKNPHAEDITKASWQINGFLPGRVELEQKQNQWTTSLQGPHLKKLGELRSNHWRYKNGLLRTHHMLTSQAQCLLDWNREYGMNGGGVKIGNYKLLVRRLNGDLKAKVYILTKDKDFKQDDNANAFIVRTNKEGEIAEIVQCSKRSEHILRLVPSNNDIFKEAYLYVTSKKGKKAFTREANSYADLIELLFSQEREESRAERLKDKMDEISQALQYETPYPITVPSEDQEAQKAKEILFQVRNLQILGDKLRLLVRPIHEEKTNPAMLGNFYRYTELQPGQISFAFYRGEIGRGGVNSTKIFGSDGLEENLRCFGPVDARREFYRNGDNVYVIKDGDLEKFMENIGIDITTEDQNKAIYRWTLLNNEELLRNLGIYVEKNLDPTEPETLHFICPSGGTTFKESHIKIPVGIASAVEIPLENFANTSPIVKSLCETFSGTQSEKRKRIQLKNIEMFHQFLKEIGFKIARPLETEAFIKKTLASDEMKKMRDFLEARLKFKPQIYKSEIGLTLLEERLVNNGYTNIERINKSEGGTMTILLKCSKDGVDYLARVLTHTENLSAKRSKLKKFAAEENRTPLLFFVEGIDLAQRQCSDISELSPDSKQYKYDDAKDPILDDAENPIPVASEDWLNQILSRSRTKKACN